MDTAPTASEPSLTADVMQLRRDQVLQRVEVAVANLGTKDFLVESLQLDVHGFHMSRTGREDEPIPAGQVVNLPVPFGAVDCPTDGAPRVGPPRVTLRVRSAGDATARKVRLTAADSDGLLQRIATRACAVEQVMREVDLRFSNRWRLERTPAGKVLHGELRARLVGVGPRSITQVAGAIMYGLRPDATARTAPAPLASLSSAHPDAHIPVVAYAARCDGHTIGEIKKPYEFLVWVASPGGDEIAVTPAVEPGTRKALRQVCSF